MKITNSPDFNYIVDAIYVVYIVKGERIIIYNSL